MQYIHEANTNQYPVQRVWKAPMILQSFGANSPQVDKGG